ncbi:MAG: acyl-ACP--UDP-N-acetylglucosamine O-acyltransferase [Candidatus Brocadiaceae bacterium]|nr:acyl-ACP--UDP-N-acetylglucosamine O-acyltransferase [Candidatus Brocadiaceae bacterium]
MKIHPSAVVESGARIGSGVEIGPHAYVGPHVAIGNDCTIGHGCHLSGRVTMGCNNILGPHVVVGTPPQDLKHHGNSTEILIGDDNVIREFATINTGSSTGSGVTRIGHRNYLMIFSHVGHDCVVEDETILVNGVLLGGHCHVESGAKLMGGAALNPFVTVGTQAYVGGLSRIVHDVPPYMIVEGNPARVRGVNEVGLQRSGYDRQVIEELWGAYKAIYRTRELNRSPIYEMLQARPGVHAETVNLVEFLRRSQKGVHGRYLESLRANARRPSEQNGA